ncbi:hypothetical protein C8Q76DRAFT_799206 [Earliella scabrosa]|nr:hypothetical protein C8Q76DRAFT_799206 [Earliella scabrosa]
MSGVPPDGVNEHAFQTPVIAATRKVSSAPMRVDKSQRFNIMPSATTSLSSSSRLSLLLRWRILPPTTMMTTPDSVTPSPLFGTIYVSYSYVDSVEGAAKPHPKWRNMSVVLADAGHGEVALLVKEPRCILCGYGPTMHASMIVGNDAEFEFDQDSRMVSWTAPGQGDRRLLFWLPEEFTAFVSLVEPAAGSSTRGAHGDAALSVFANTYTQMLLSISAKGFAPDRLNAGQPRDEDMSAELGCLCLGLSSDTDEGTSDGETSAEVLALFSAGDTAWCFFSFVATCAAFMAHRGVVIAPQLLPDLHNAFKVFRDRAGCQAFKELDQTRLA